MLPHVNADVVLHIAAVVLHAAFAARYGGWL
jgi:hypothetical protein